MYVSLLSDMNKFVYSFEFSNKHFLRLCFYNFSVPKIKKAIALQSWLGYFGVPQSVD